MLAFVNTAFIFICISLFGLVNFTSDRILFGVNTLDFALVFINLLFIKFFIEKKSFNQMVTSKPGKYFFYIYIFVLFVVVTMPLRGDTGVVSSLMVARDFLILPIAFLICYDISINKNANFYYRLFIFIGIFTSIQIIINAISPKLINTLFSHVTAEEKLKHSLQRNYFRSKSMLFPHLCVLLVFFTMIRNGISKKKIILFFVFLLASGLQGFRSYFIALLFFIGAYFLSNIKRRFVKRFIVITIFLIPVVYIADNIFLKSQITNKFITASIDVDEDKEKGNTLKGRYERDQLNLIPRFLEKPFLGWGFIHYSSDYGKQIGLKSRKMSDREDGLYSIDSGYLTMLMYFGGIGLVIFIVIYLLFIYYLKKMFKSSVLPFIVIGFSLVLILSLITHGGFYSDFGLLPLSISVGFVMGILISK